MQIPPWQHRSIDCAHSRRQLRSLPASTQFKQESKVMKPSEKRRAIAAIGAIIAFTTLACGKSDRTRTDSGVVASAVPVQGAAPPGGLAKPIDQYSGEEFFALT